VYDVSIRTRGSLGLEITRYLGGFGDSSETVIHIPCMNSDQTIGFLAKQKSRLEINNFAYIQLAILYTTVTGEERTRVFNYAFGVTNSLSNTLINDR